MLRITTLFPIGGKSDSSVSVTSGNGVRVHSREAVEVKIKTVRREGFKSAITFVVRNLPSGWTANAEGIGADRAELTLRIRPYGSNTKPFMERDKKLPPVAAYIEAIADDFRFIVGTLEIPRPSPKKTGTTTNE